MSHSASTESMAICSLGEEPFYEAFARCLYQGISIEELPVRATQKQLAALAIKSSNPSTLFTTNYDPLLEKAIAQLQGEPEQWATHRRPFAGTAGQSEANTEVQHIHGWLDPDGRAGGTLILTETSYLDLAIEHAAEPNKALGQLLNGDGALVIVGMSLSDPNLRRLLHHRRRKQLKSASNQVFAVMSRDNSPIDEFLLRYWQEWGVKLLFVNGHEYLPALLRDIVWGIDAGTPPWFPHACKWVGEHAPPDVLFSDHWQAFAYRSLRELTRRVRIYFGVELEERLVFSLFLPVHHEDEAAIWKVASSRERRSGAAAQEHARDRILRIRRQRSQGVAGVAFEDGIPTEVLDNGPGIDYEFDAEMVAQWADDDSFRGWRSILAVPVLDSEHWVPVAVITVTSNFDRPFWCRFGDREAMEMPELKRLMRRVAKWQIAQYDTPVVIPGTP